MSILKISGSAFHAHYMFLTLRMSTEHGFITSDPVPGPGHVMIGFCDESLIVT